MKDSASIDTSWGQARRLLGIRLDNMGDVLMTTPAIRALRSAVPGRSVDLWCSPSGAAIARMVPEIDRTLVARVPWMKVPDASDTDTRAMIDTLRDGRYDAAVIFTVYSQSPLPAALACHLAGIPLVLAHCRENPYHLLSEWVPEPEPGSHVRHEVQRQLDLVAHVGAPATNTRLSLAVPELDRARLHGKLAHLGIFDGEPWIVAHCGATAASRRYPAERYAEVLTHLGRRHGHVLLTGTPDEKDLVAGIAREAGGSAIDLAGALTLGELAALIEEADLLISNNSGPVHMAAALGTPVVVLYALTNPQHTPWEVPQRVLYHDVPCKYCYRSVCPQGHHACLAGVTSGEVIAAAESLLCATRKGGHDRDHDSSQPPDPNGDLDAGQDHDDAPVRCDGHGRGAEHPAPLVQMLDAALPGPPPRFLMP